MLVFLDEMKYIWRYMRLSLYMCFAPRVSLRVILPLGGKLDILCKHHEVMSISQLSDRHATS
jgi:hypothetical protein